MGDIVLPHNVSIIPQETFYWCGPASTQVALDVRGIGSDERDLAGQLGTDQDGTDHIGLIRDLLNRNVGPVYVTRVIPGADATDEQRELLWSDVRASVRAGYAVVCNIDVYPSSYPKATRGMNPKYSGGRVMHYFTAVGFNEDTGEVLVADSGFKPFEYWMSAAQLATCIAGKGYTAAPDVAPPVDPDAATWARIDEQFMGPA